MASEGLTTEELMARYLSPEREQELDPFRVLTFMPVEPYDHVADIGCGPGYFTIPLAKYLVYGQLYALDIHDEMLEVARRRVAEARLGNVQVLKCSPTEFPVPSGSLDGALLAFVVHHGENPDGLLGAVRDLLKPRGWCTVLEWLPREGGEGPPAHNRVPPDVLRELAARSGFRFQGWRDLNDKHYMATLRR